MKLKRRGRDWIQYSLNLTMGTLPGMTPTTTEIDRISATSQFGGLWIPPEELQDLSPGQVLDRDPYTKFVVSVGRPGRDAQGNRVVEIVEQGEEQRIDYAYDRSTGILRSWSQQDGHLYNLKTSLTLVGRE